MVKRLVLFDRDGCLNFIKNGEKYQTRADSLEINKEAIEVVPKLLSRGVKIGVVSNQRGISLGLVTWEVVEQIHTAMVLAFKINQSEFPLYVCPHDIIDGCLCRKPKPGLILRALRESDCEGSETVFVGDSYTDYEAALHAGVSFLSYRPNRTSENGNIEVISNLNEIVERIT